MKSRKSKRERQRPAQVRVPFERAHLEVARQALELAGLRTAEHDEAAAMAVFSIGLGMITGHYNELLAKRLHEAHVRAFGPDGPKRFREAAMSLHAGATMPELAAALLDGATPPSPQGVSNKIQ